MANLDEGEIGIARRNDDVSLLTEHHWRTDGGLVVARLLLELLFGRSSISSTRHGSEEMTHSPKRTIVFFVAMLAIASADVLGAAHAKQPNFLVIVADDLGFSDIGAFGGEIDTPNLDALAYRGLRLTDFHSAAACSPARSMLLSGTDNHLAGLGDMAELVASNQIGQSGYEGYLRADVATLAERLREANYTTMMSGKWHLGTTIETDPSNRGFRYSFALLQGGHNHFGTRVSVDPAKGSTYRLNGQTLDALPADFYSSDYFTDRLLDFLADSATDGRPFFAYLAFTAPHWPLQAPAADIEKYRGRYDGGFEQLRAARLRRQIDLGLLEASVVPHEPGPNVITWSSLSEDQRAEQRRLMEVYAAMVDRLDRNVGRVVEYLVRSGRLDDTVILFLSDNGAEAIDRRTAGPAIGRIFAAADNRVENLGSMTSFLSYGPGWAVAVTAPAWLYKGYATEGGTHVPAFITYPGLKRQRATSDAFGTVTDIAPTFLELAGQTGPTDTFEGRKVQPVIGRSWVPYLTGTADAVHRTDEAVGFELFGSRAIRKGPWKALHQFDGEWMLFDVAHDPGETRDLAAEQPAQLTDLIADWDRYAQRVRVVLPSESTYRP